MSYEFSVRSWDFRLVSLLPMIPPLLYLDRKDRLERFIQTNSSDKIFSLATWAPAVQSRLERLRGRGSHQTYWDLSLTGKQGTNAPKLLSTSRYQLAMWNRRVNHLGRFAGTSKTVAVLWVRHRVAEQLHIELTQGSTRILVLNHNHHDTPPGAYHNVQMGTNFKGYCCKWYQIYVFGQTA